MRCGRFLAIGVALWLLLGRLLGPGVAWAAGGSEEAALELLAVEPPPSKLHRPQVLSVRASLPILRQMVRNMVRLIGLIQFDGSPGPYFLRIAEHQHAIALFHVREAAVYLERVGALRGDRGLAEEVRQLDRRAKLASDRAGWWLRRAMKEYVRAEGWKGWATHVSYPLAGYFIAELGTAAAVMELRHGRRQKARKLAAEARAELAGWLRRWPRHALVPWAQLHLLRLDVAFGAPVPALAALARHPVAAGTDRARYVRLLEAAAYVRLGDAARAVALLLPLAADPKARPEVVRAARRALPPLLAVLRPGAPWRALLADAGRVGPCFAVARVAREPLEALASCARFRRAEALASLGRFTEAAEGYERAAQALPGEPSRLMALARAATLYEAVGDASRAARLRERLEVEAGASRREQRGHRERRGQIARAVMPSRAAIAGAAWEVVRATLADVGPARAEADLRWYLRVFARDGDPAHHLEALVRLAWLRWAASCRGIAGLGLCLPKDAAGTRALERSGERGERGAAAAAAAPGPFAARRAEVLREVRALLREARRIWARPARIAAGRVAAGPGAGHAWAVAARLLEAELALAPTLSVRVPNALERRLRRPGPERADWRVLEGHIRRKVREVEALEQRLWEAGAHALAPRRHPRVQDRGPAPGRAPISTLQRGLAVELRRSPRGRSGR